MTTAATSQREPTGAAERTDHPDCRRLSRAMVVLLIGIVLDRHRAEVVARVLAVVLGQTRVFLLDWQPRG